MTNTPEKSTIPDFKNYQEEAEFWDTHDFTDYLGDFRPVKVCFAKNLSEVLPVRLDRQTVAQLKAQASEKGIGATTLVRMWVLEHLRHNPHGSATV